MFKLKLALCLALVAVGPGFALTKSEAYDHHVHLMSPRMIKLFKDVGIPFSRPDAQYSVIETVVESVGAKRMNLLSMAYLYGHPEFGKVEDEEGLVRAENDFVMAARARFPATIKAYCGVNPLKDYALSEVRRCGEQLRADGIKLHFNASQVYLTEPEHVKKVLPVFEYAARRKLPVMLHFDNSHRLFGARDAGLLRTEILAKIKPMKLTIAHFGTSGGFGPRTVAVIDALIAELEKPDMKRHRVYFDISAVALDKDSDGVSKLNDEQFKELAVSIRKIGVKRVVFGTDYPLYSATDYIRILRERVGLTGGEIKVITTRK